MDIIVKRPSLRSQNYIEVQPSQICIAYTGFLVKGVPSIKDTNIIDDTRLKVMNVFMLLNSLQYRCYYMNVTDDVLQKEDY
jgi:hypothetical protein